MTGSQNMRIVDTWIVAIRRVWSRDEYEQRLFWLANGIKLNLSTCHNP